AWDEELTVEVNLVATRMIAEIAKAHNVRRFLFASTCSVYGASDDILDEKSTLNPVSLYARSKIASERVLSEFEDDDFKPVILRFGTIFGLSGRTRFDLVVNLLTAKALFEKSIPVMGGDQWRPFVHVHDAARGVLLALEAPLRLVGGEVFNVGSNANNHRIREIGQMICDEVEGSQLEIDDKDADRRDYRVCFDKIERRLRFKAEWSVKDGIRQIIESVRSGQVTSYTEPQHSNIAYLHEAGDSAFTKKQRVWTSELLNLPELPEELTKNDGDKRAS
ncbi:MAG: NAD-dependent dehydratase, partial [Opitutae bacterium]|nr:NAD-dependent dehydratase [Opitutae bacterium]